MKTKKRRIVISGVLALGVLLWGMPSSARPTQSKEAGLQWPRPVPCRIADGANKDLFIITLGDIDTSLASGVYDPRTDEVRLKDGLRARGCVPEAIRGAKRAANHPDLLSRAKRRS